MNKSSIGYSERIGQVVKLKSGGPLMTIIWKNNGYSVRDIERCRWFDSNGILYEDAFDVDSLEFLDVKDVIELKQGSEKA